jgi:hypothetical protein
MQNLRQSTWEYEILYADRSSVDEQLSTRPLLTKMKKYDHDGRLNIKIHILFYEDNP